MSEITDSTISENQKLLEKIRNQFPGISNPTEPYNFLTIEFIPEDCLKIIGFLKNELGFGYLTDLCGMHYPGGHLIDSKDITAGSDSEPGNTIRSDSEPGNTIRPDSEPGNTIRSDSESAGHGTGSGYSTSSEAGAAYGQGYNTENYTERQVEFDRESKLRGEQPIPETKGELGVIYHLHALKTNTRIRLKAFFPAAKPEIDSLTPLFKGANWMERETYDFYGIIFKGHPDLRRILNVDEMIAFPMRKEFPLEDQHRKDKQDQFFGR